MILQGARQIYVLLSQFLILLSLDCILIICVQYRNRKALIRELCQNIYIILSQHSQMKKMIIDSIQQLKQSKDQSPNSKHAPSTATVQPFHRKPDEGGKGKLFDKMTCMFPLVDIELTPKKIELLSNNIRQQGGKVVEFKGKMAAEQIDFILINPHLQIDSVRHKIDQKVNYKEILDYHFVTETLKEQRKVDYQQYSLYVNIINLEEKPRVQSQVSSDKKRKMEESDNDTVKLSDDEDQIQGKILVGQKGQKVDVEQRMLGPTKPHSFSMNTFIADELTKLQKIYATERDIGRKIAYMKASAVIRGLDRQIETQRDVDNIKGIGQKIGDKIRQLITTGHVEKLQTLQKSQRTIVCGELSNVWGIGPSKAQELFNAGARSIADLHRYTYLLTTNQKIGLKYHSQFQTKIARQKITRMFTYVKSMIEKVVPSLQLYNIEVCGSYRRGKATCGDMDIIISRKDGVYESRFLIDIVAHLQKVGFLTDHLTHPKAGEGRSSVSYMGVCRFEQPTHHRIDIKYYPIEEFAYAILYFTGSGMFNRMLRLHTMKLGLQLSDHGAVAKTEKGITWKAPIPICYTEKDIFNYLGLDQKTPSQRDM